MKTFSEYQAERAAQHQADLEERTRLLETRRASIESLIARNLPLHPNTYEKKRLEIRSAVANGCDSADLACDTCSAELFFNQPGSMMLTGARSIGCPGCGWSSSIRL